MKRVWQAVSLMVLAAGMNLSAADFLPLAPGNQWTYQDAVTGQSFTVQVALTQYFVNGHTYQVLKGYTPKQLIVRVNEYGNIVFWDEEREADVMLTAFEFAHGARFEAHARECPEQGQVQERRVVHDGPAGKWNALEIRYLVLACADTGDISEQFAENIGMVQRVVNTFAGPRTFNLVHAKLGNQVISAGSTGSFTVSALPGQQPGTWTATLRISQPLSSNLKLNFTSGQEYDARLRDSAGNIVWVWSADKLFIQAVHSVAVGGGWSANITVPHPPAIPEGSHAYTLEAWVTNVEGEPRFAAATTVEVVQGTNASVFTRKIRN